MLGLRFFAPLAACTALVLLALSTGCSSSTPAQDSGGDASTSIDPGTPADDDGGTTDDPQADAGGCDPMHCAGCCSADGRCIKTPSAAACGPKGGACVVCNKKDLACVSGKCGCTKNDECADGYVCDVARATCTVPCTAGACSSGCCASTGFCATGQDGDACGGAGACLDCRNNATGHGCVAGKCGCNSAADCANGYACDTSTHTCTTTCNANQPCNGGCCDGATNRCTYGGSNTACGKTGVMCVSCAGDPNGASCVSGACGCYGASNCPTGQACNTTTHACTTTCSANQPCNGGCCAGTTCAAGNASNACGGGGAMCSSCSSFGDGPVCKASAFGNKCGCDTAADCGGGRNCQAGAGRSYTYCCKPKGAACTTGAECCSGGCAGIGGNLTCG